MPLVTTGAVQPEQAMTALGVAVLPARARQALEHQLQVATVELARQLHVVLLETELELERQAEAARGAGLHESLSGSMRLLRDAGPGLVDAFMRVLEAGVASLRAPRTTHRLQDLEIPSGGLSLVDDSALDEGATLGSIAARSESRNSLALQLLGYRYGVLAAGPAFDAEHLPVGPNAMCHALRSGCNAIDLPLEARLALYRLFEKIAMAHYPALLETLNARLADDGVLPHLSFVPVRARAATPGPGRGAPPRAARGDNLTAPKAGAAGDPPRAVEHHPEDEPARDEFAQLQDLLARRRRLLAKFRPAAIDERTRAALARDEVQGALRRLRGSDASHGTLVDIRRTLLAQARQSHGHGVALAEDDNDGFELFGLFQAQLQRELRPGSPGEALLARLRMPLLQLGLRDHRFFVDPQHPARLLQDAVSLAGARWLAEDDLDAQWLGLLQRAVGTILEDPDAALDTFVSANHALQGGLQAAARKNEMAERRQVEAARGRERLAQARQRANDEIVRAVGGRVLPRFHALLLEQAWADVLSLALLRSGDASEAWRTLCDATRAIVETSAAPTRSPDPQFLAQLQDALGQVGYHAEDAAAIARQLANGRVDDDELATRTELVVQLKARARLGEEAMASREAASAPRTPAEQAAHAALCSLDAGCWVDLLDPADDAVVRRRLAWVSPRGDQALLLNRRGLRVGDETLDSLARRLSAGTLQLVESELYPAERAWRATIASLERIAGDEHGEPRHG